MAVNSESRAESLADSELEASGGRLRLRAFSRGRPAALGGALTKPECHSALTQAGKVPMDREPLASGLSASECQ